MLSGFLARAQGDRLPAGLLRCNPLTGVDCTFAHLGDLLVDVFRLLLFFAAVVAVGFVVWGGIQMAKAWFEEEAETGFKEGKLTVRRAVWGLVLVVGAYLIVEVTIRLFTGAGGKGINDFLRDAFG